MSHKSSLDFLENLLNENNDDKSNELNFNNRKIIKKLKLRNEIIDIPYNENDNNVEENNDDFSE